MVGQQILVISQDGSRARQLDDALRHSGFSVVSPGDAANPAPDLLSPDNALAVVDLSLPGLDRAALAHAVNPQAPSATPEPLEAVERRHILATLHYTGWNKRRAAHILGIARSTLIQKVRRYNLSASGNVVKE